ncbi:hypothetical protein [Streptomyces adelaidensis]|uniref:hypothetical protein n=1 Tax=Streptomyces adelaidensis TaxID=2796465 RepID=UPI001904DA6D|nr:hypothetical protein [Streptomyces adelaidensis]
MGGELTYQNITATVRPPRCAIFINRNSGHWKTAADGAIAAASEVWGGRYFLIIPTDGASIADKYWELLEAYSPDYLATYSLSFLDLEYADPKIYQRAKERQRKEWIAKEFPMESFERLFSESASMSHHDQLEITDDLQKELLYRLSPFHHDTYAIDQHVSRSSGFGYPFTKIAKIASCATQPIGQVNLPKSEIDPTLSLLIHSQTGTSSEGYQKDMDEQGFITKSIPDDYDSLDLFGELIGENQLHGQSGGYAQNVPFTINMLHLGQYYRVDLHRTHKEPVVLVLGDTVDDFCLYYSLSRMHEGVIWLPLAWLKNFTVALNRRRKLREQGSTNIPPFTATDEAARRLVGIAFGLIKYGHDPKRLQLCSMSLSKRQLVAYKSQMARSSVESSRFIAATDCVDIASISTSCALRVFEQANYANYRSMGFIDGKSVSPLDTPKPKNFSEIRLGDHYWLTSLQVEGYQPPSLPTLGPDILKLFRGSSTTESRVANDGVVYLCPNAMIFGNELDSVLVRPKIEMPDVMSLFDSYFAATDVTTQYSDKGKFFNDTVSRFGGLDELGKFIKAKATRSVLDKFMQTNKNVDDGVFYVRTDQRAYLDLDAFAASIGSKEAAADLVDELLTKDVLQRGYILKCERCSLSSWYGLNALSSTFTCNRCSFRQQFTQKHWKNGMVEPRWCYKLAETVYQFYEKNSHLTAQVLYKLKSQSTTAFHYAPEIDLLNFAGPGKSREMDVACILDGQIVFGECKTETLKLKDVEKFEALVRKHLKNPARIVFATTQSVSDDFKKRMSRLPNAELMVRSDLYDD